MLHFQQRRIARASKSPQLLLALTICAASIFVGSTAFADTEFPPSLGRMYLNCGESSGLVERVPVHPKRGAQPAWRTVVGDTNAAWIRLNLAGTRLIDGAVDNDRARIRIASLVDASEQWFDARSLAQWQSTSAYFNGGRVLVEFYPGEIGGSEVVIDGMWVERTEGELASICGTTDDRTAITDARVGRLMPIGCTAWLFSGQHFGMLTAGHCFPLNPTEIDVVEFDVPPSLVDGTPQHPPVESQFVIDPTSVQSAFVLIGNDWGYFGVYPNLATGDTVLEARGGSFAIGLAAAPVAGDTITVRGYGSDSGAANATLQTHTGPYAIFNSVTTSVWHQADTRGGNSGGPMTLNGTATSIGIHTNGGCAGANPETSANSGTTFQNAGLLAALVNPQGIAAAPGPGLCGSPVNPNCYTVHATTACNDMACCTTVCTADPFCCNTEWDSVCVSRAWATCDAPNDTCSGARQITLGDYPLTMDGASSEGPADACGGGIVRDRWYRYTASAAGVLRVTMCSDAFDSRIAIYENAGATCWCPDSATPSTLVGCSAALSACGRGAKADVSVVAGRCYMIRAAVRNADVGGSATLSLDLYTTPANDTCVNAAVVGNGSHSFATLAANTDGTTLPVECNTSGYTQVGKDVWYRYTAPCSGTVTVSTCGSVDFDSKLAVYTGVLPATCSCPPTIGTMLVGCNDDGVGCSGWSSRVEFEATQGRCYMIRVGGHNGASGVGSLAISCAVACPSDVNGSGAVDAADLSLLLAAWGTANTDADVNNDGTVNAADLSLLLDTWGACN